MKNSLDDLAVFGGARAFDEKLYVGRPNIGDRAQFIARINEILDNRWLTNNGPYVQELERRIADLVGVKHCIAMCNATIALEIAIRATGMKGEVIVPSFTFVATAHALQWQEITPVFCDVDPVTHNLSPAHVEQLITERTSGILAVHLWGRGCDVDALASVARRHNLRLIYDAAHAFGCSHGGRMIGNFGDAEVFSFHATKFFNSFEGGAVTTNDDALAEKMRLMKNFGFAGYDNVIYIGTNGKMNEVSAAMGLTSLDSMDSFIATNQRHYEQYRRELFTVPGVDLINYDGAERCNYQYVVLEIDERETRIGRDELLQILWAENVIARRYFYPGVHRMEPYRTLYPTAAGALPATERLSARVLLLPTGTAVDEEMVLSICRIIRVAVEHGAEATSRLHPEATANVSATEASQRA
jgi:dTDP-4-amino-4,6-dideoxygalactose transaminase